MTLEFSFVDAVLILILTLLFSFGIYFTGHKKGYKDRKKINLYKEKIKFLNQTTGHYFYVVRFTIYGALLTDSLYDYDDYDNYMRLRNEYFFDYAKLKDVMSDGDRLRFVRLKKEMLEHKFDVN